MAGRALERLGGFVLELGGLGLEADEMHGASGHGMVHRVHVVVGPEDIPDFDTERCAHQLAYARLIMHRVTTGTVWIETLDVTEGTPDDAVFVINTTNTPEEMAKKLGRSADKVFTVDATQISIDTLGRPIPNTPLLGALVRATGLVKLETLILDLSKTLGKKFPEKIVKGNTESVERAYKEVKTK